MMTEYYKNDWSGDFVGSDNELTVLLSRAEIVVNNAVMLSGITVSTVPEALKKPMYSAVCAQADFIAENGGLSALSENSSGGSVSLGKYSYSGGCTESGGSLCGLCPQAVAILESTGLLNRGVIAI
jgi:hypothetical protein